MNRGEAWLSPGRRASDRSSKLPEQLEVRCSADRRSADRKGNYAGGEKSYFLLSFVSFFFYPPLSVLKEKMTHEEVKKIFQ